MKKLLLLALLFILSVFLIPNNDAPELSEKDRYRDFINNHEFSLRERLTPEQIKKMPKRDRPDLAWEQDFLATMDPSQGRPTPEALIPVYNQISQMRNNLMTTPGATSSPWVERGPSNVSGRTRAIAFDPNDVTLKKVWAGGVTGGLWYNNDITNPSSQWVAVNDFWDNISITSISFDPTNTQVIYVGTGEGWGAGAARGAGVWKSTNGGTSWTQLSATSSFYYVNDLVVRNESGSGVLYVATRGNYYGQSWHGSASQGLQRSTNGGVSFSQVLPNIPGESQNFAAADIEIGADNKLWVGTTTSSYGLTDRGGGRILTSTNGTTWTTAYTHSGGERVEVACAPSNTNYAYALIEASNQVDAIVKTTNNGSTWSSVSEPNDADGGIPSTDFSRGQAWYDLIIAVDPNNPNNVITGAIDLFKTTNGGSSWSQISHWYGGFGYPEVHADQHQIVFKPGSSSEVLFGNDGGIYRTTNATSSFPSFTNLNNGYNVTQFYACAIHPTAGSNYFLGGTQDNGSQQFTTAGINSTNEVTGGDGAFCFIDQTNPNYQITSYVYNSYWRSTDGGNSFGTRFQTDQNTGKFINPADYDDNLDILYSARTTSTINRVTGISSSPSIGSFTVSGMSSMASHLRVSPYTTTSTTLFVGTESGDLYKITNANSSPSTTSIGSSLPSGNISCVEIGASENELLVTYTNYGVTSVWYTNNGGTSWVSKEGNLPNMPVRWALFNPNDRNEVLLATEVGVWSTTNLNNSSPSWNPSNSGLANVRVDMLQMRDSDQEVIAATHGRGFFSSNGFAAAQLPVPNFSVSDQHPCTNQAVQLGDSTTGNPTSWQWTITPNTFSFTSGTSASSQHPEVTFTAAGSYTVKLVVSNANGMDSLTLTSAIEVGGYSLPFSEDFETSSVGEWLVDNPDGLNTWSLYTVAGNTPGNLAAGVNNFSYNAAGQRDGLISPPLNLTGLGQVNLSFEYAYRRYNSTYNDSLAVYISTDCGTTWSQVALYGENGSGNFVTGAATTASFVPNATSDWCNGTGSPSCPSIDISAYGGNPNVRVKFANICDYGNNLYIDNVNITGSVGVAPVADFSANKTTGCPADTVVFTDASTSNPTSWSWSFTPSTVTFINGTSATSQNPEVTFNAAGTYQVTLNATNSVGSDAEIKASYISISPAVVPTLGVTSSATLPICAGDNITFTANATNAGTTPTYQWKVNGVNAGTNSSTFSTTTLSNNDVVSVELQSSLPCSGSMVFASMTVPVDSVVTPSVSIAASATSICSGTNVTFTATPINGGTPTYQWKVNGSNVSGGGSIYSSTTLSNGDQVSVVMTSSKNCVTASTATSNIISMNVSSAVAPFVSISSNDTVVCTGSSSTFTATPINAGSSPSYQWKVNGTNAGTNSSSFTSTLSNNDAVTVVVTSSLTCASPTTATSNAKTVSVLPDPQVTINTVLPTGPLCKEDSLALSATVNNFGNPGSGSWSGPGVVGTNFIAANVSSGLHTLTYTYTYAGTVGCPKIETIQVNTELVPTPTISANGPVLTCNESGFNYQWILNGAPISGATSQNYTITGNGSYSVQIGLSGCSDQSAAYVVNDFGMDDLKTALGFTIYPNPTHDKSTFEFTNPGSGNISYQLIAFNGSVVSQKEITGNGRVKETISMRHLAAGFYTLRIKAGDHTIIEKLGKQ